jgi:hypothetical protein
LEIKTIKYAIANLFCQVVRTLDIALYIHHPTVEGAHKATLLIDLIFEQHHQGLLRFSKMSPEAPQDFFNLFQEVHPIPEGIHQHSMLDLNDMDAIDAADASFKDLLDAPFCCSWTVYIHVLEEETLCQLDLQESVKNQLKEQATAPAEMDVNLITTNSPELAKAVKAHVAKHTKSHQSLVS